MPKIEVNEKLFFLSHFLLNYDILKEKDKIKVKTVLDKNNDNVCIFKKHQQDENTKTKILNTILLEYIYFVDNIII